MAIYIDKRKVQDYLQRAVILRKHPFATSFQIGPSVRFGKQGTPVTDNRKISKTLVKAEEREYNNITPGG